jgi:hypothetical protein
VFRHMYGSPVDAQQAILRTSRCVLAVAKFAAHLLVPVVAPAASPGASAEELERALDRANTEHLAAVCDHLAAVEGHEDEPEARRRVAERLEVDVHTYRRAAARGCVKRKRVLQHLDLGDTEAAPGRCLGSIVVDTARRALLGRSLKQRMAEELCALWASGNEYRNVKAVNIKKTTWMTAESAWSLISKMKEGKHQRVLAALRALASGTDEAHGDAARALVEKIDEGLAATEARAAQPCFTPTETAKQLCDRWAGDTDAWKEKAKDVKARIKREFRNKYRSVAEAKNAGERAKDAHIKHYGIWKERRLMCAGSLISEMKDGKHKQVREALRTLASGTDETHGEAARALIKDIDESLADKRERDARQMELDKRERDAPPPAAAAAAGKYKYVPPASRRKAQPERDQRVAAVIATGAPPELGPLKMRYAALYGQHSNRPCPWALHHAVQYKDLHGQLLNARNKEVRYEQEALKLWRDQHAHCDCVVCTKRKK